MHATTMRTTVEVHLNLTRNAERCTEDRFTVTTGGLSIQVFEIHAEVGFDPLGHPVIRKATFHGWSVLKSGKFGSVRKIDMAKASLSDGDSAKWMTARQAIREEAAWRRPA